MNEQHCVKCDSAKYLKILKESVHSEQSKDIQYLNNKI